jgi:uncharacterized protein (DUF1499 family)
LSWKKTRVITYFYKNGKISKTENYINIGRREKLEHIMKMVFLWTEHNYLVIKLKGEARIYRDILHFGY